MEAVKLVHKTQYSITVPNLEDIASRIFSQLIP